MGVRRNGAREPCLLSGRDVSSPRSQPPEGARIVAPGFSPGSPPQIMTSPGRGVGTTVRSNPTNGNIVTLRSPRPNAAGVPFGKKVRATGNTHGHRETLTVFKFVPPLLSNTDRRETKRFRPPARPFDSSIMNRSCRSSGRQSR